ncbi:MAG: hypothetical protein IJ050_04985 [Clostridia bacterium]|nr:hypothetical protein [Clostridia bacterium]
MSKGKAAAKTVICVLLAAFFAAGAEFLLSDYRFFEYRKYDDNRLFSPKCLMSIFNCSHLTE